MTVSLMKEEHLAGVKALLDMCFLNAWSTENIKSELKKKEAYCFVALENDAVVAYLAFEKILDEGTVVELAVEKSYRRRGIARRMLTSAISSFYDLKSVTLEVRKSNLSAVSLYRSLGFEEVSERKNYYTAPAEDALIMTKRLKR